MGTGIWDGGWDLGQGQRLGMTGIPALMFFRSSCNKNKKKLYLGTDKLSVIFRKLIISRADKKTSAFVKVLLQNLCDVKENSKGK